MEEKYHQRRKVSTFLSHQERIANSKNSMRGSEIDALSVLSYLYGSQGHIQHTHFRGTFYSNLIIHAVSFGELVPDMTETR